MRYLWGYVLLFPIPLTGYRSVGIMCSNSGREEFAAAGPDGTVQGSRAHKPVYVEVRMKYRGTLIVVTDLGLALKVYRDLLGLQLLQDNGGNMGLTDNL